jgi:hypothetical protein
VAEFSIDHFVTTCRDAAEVGEQLANAAWRSKEHYDEILRLGDVTEQDQD